MGDGWKAWTRERLSAVEFQGYVQDQVVMSFASSAARTAMLAGAETEGMHSYLEDVNRTEVYDGSGWREVGAGQVIGFGQLTATVGSITTTAVRLTAMAFSCTLLAGRQYEYNSTGRMFTTVAGDIGGIAARVTLGAGGVAVTDPMVAGITTPMAATTATNLYSVRATELFQVATSGSYQVNLWAQRVNGTGTLSFQATSTGRAQQFITDRGVVQSGVPFPV